MYLLARVRIGPIHNVLNDLKEWYDVKICAIGCMSGEYVFHHGIVV